MALMSAQRSSSFKPSSSSETPPWRYDVFLSFRGGDICDNFLEYLNRALRQKGILTFKDDDKLKDGETIKDGLLEAIEESRFSIVVLSTNYADSSRCLNELVRILECKRTTRQVVYPVFYHVKPSEVRKQGTFGKMIAIAPLKKEEYAFLEEEEAEMKRWTEALEEVGNLKGWVYPDAKFPTEANLIDDLVHTIFNESVDANHVLTENTAKPETVEKVCGIVRKQLAIPVETEITGESKFASLGADTVEIVVELEEEFGISIEEESAQSIATVQDAADLIEKLIGQN